MTTWRMRIPYLITKATNTYSDYVIHIAFPLQQWLHERASLLRYTYIAWLVVHCPVGIPTYTKIMHSNWNIVHNVFFCLSIASLCINRNISCWNFTTYNELLQLMNTTYVCISSCLMDASLELLRVCWRLQVYGEYTQSGRTHLSQCFSIFVRPRLGKAFFHKTRARSQQIYS